MKLRIRGDSLRLRLTRAEVARVGAGGRVEEAVSFGPDSRLVYALETAAGARRVEADYDGAAITVRLPEGLARAWAASEQVSLEAEQPLGGDGGAALRLLVEKDFACLTERRGADDEDTFPHPLEGTAHC